MTRKGHSQRQRGPQLLLKRVVDVALAGTALVVTAPVWPIVGAAIVLEDGWPILFKQQRPGRDAKPFNLLKFRTMSRSPAKEGHPQFDAERLTRAGRWLRDLSLDELPQLLNVLRGDMSLVGPRPLLMRYLPRYSATQSRRHEVLPGITGWAQVNGRNAVSWETKFSCDVWYVEHWSVWLDLSILFKTVASVVRRDGVSSPEHVTMPEFMGTLEQERGAER